MSNAVLLTDEQAQSLLRRVHGESGCTYPLEDLTLRYGPSPFCDRWLWLVLCSRSGERIAGLNYSYAEDGVLRIEALDVLPQFRHQRLCTLLMDVLAAVLPAVPGVTTVQAEYNSMAGMHSVRAAHARHWPNAELVEGLGDEPDDDMAVEFGWEPDSSD